MIGCIGRVGCNNPISLNSLIGLNRHSGERIGRYWRMAKDYEKLTEISEAMVHIAMKNLMSKRLNTKQGVL